MPTTSSPTSPAPSRASSSAALALWLALAGLQIAAAFALGAGGDTGGDGEPLYGYSLAVGSLFIYGILAGLSLWVASLSPGRLRSLGLRRFPPRALPLVAGIVLLALIVSAALEPVLHAGREQGLEPAAWRPDRIVPFVLNATVIVTVVPFTEELFYRGLGVSVLRVAGVPLAIVGTAVAFGLAHGILAALPALGFFGLLLAWLRVRTDSVWPCVLAHAAYNGLGVAAFFVA
ncbi:MAG: CPBP family intramembrane metalloprotease [Thermoleophilia bacterium]|nr:CPBP family intramembrane metalloprotease [Thermoleophilia bacterium]